MIHPFFTIAAHCYAFYEIIRKCRITRNDVQIKTLFYKMSADIATFGLRDIGSAVNHYSGLEPEELVRSVYKSIIELEDLPESFSIYKYSSIFLPSTYETSSIHFKGAALVSMVDQLTSIRLILARDDANRSDYQGTTLLHYTTYNGYLEFSKALIAAGADVNIVNQDGNIALHLAASKGDLEVDDICVYAFELSQDLETSPINGEADAIESLHQEQLEITVDAN